MWSRNRLRQGPTVVITTALIVLVTSGAAHADCHTLISAVDPNCLVRQAGGAVASSLAGKMAEGAAWLAQQIGDGARTAGRPDVTKSWFGDTYITTREIGVLFATVGMLLSLIYAALKRDVHEIGRTLARVVTAGLTTGGIAVVVATANNLVDDVCVYALGPRGWAVIADALKQPIKLLGHVSGTMNATTPKISVPAVIAVLIATLMLIALAIIWCELLVRRVAIDLCVLFWPLAVSGAVWAGAKYWTRKLVDTLTCLVLSKLFIVLIIRFAAAALTNMRSVSDLLIAVGVYAMAALTPFWVMRLVGFIGGAVQPGHTGEGVRGAAIAAGTAAAFTTVRVGGSMVSGAGTMAAASRMPMPARSRPTSEGGFQPGGHGGTAKAEKPQPTSARSDRTASPEQGVGQQGESAGGQQARPRPVPDPPPLPRPYPARPVPPHLRPQPAAPAEGGGGGGEGAPDPSARPAPRPAPWPGPRPNDPSAPARRPRPWPPTPPTTPDHPTRTGDER